MSSKREVSRHPRQLEALTASRSSALFLLLLGAASALGCTGTVGSVTGEPGAPGNSPPGVTGGGTTAAGSLGVKRLSVREYEQSLRDLFASPELTPGATLVAERSLGFDNIGAALGMTETQLDGFLRATEATVTQVLAKPERAAVLLGCPGQAAGSRDCAAAIVNQFLPRAWRRPLAAGEADALLALFDRSSADGALFPEAMGDLFVAALSSPKFLFRFDNAQGCAAGPKPLPLHALASRLSYTLWSSIPDAALAAKATSGALADSAVLEAEVDRMLDDPEKGGRFVDSFAGQWLSMEQLQSHTVSPMSFPQFNEGLRSAMASEMRAFFRSFVDEGRPWREFLTAPTPYRDDVLAAHYRNEVRSGFLQLGGFLTLASKPDESAPTKRATTVMSQLLCTHLMVPPNLEEKINESIEQFDFANTTARQRLEVHRAEASCAGCHAILDPIGLGLENYDGIGRFRTTYTNGLAIDPSGVFAGQSFSGPDELARVVAQDPRLDSCLTETLFVYGMGRGVNGTDTATLQRIEEGWRVRKGGVRGLIKAFVLSEAFRNFQPLAE